MAPVAAVTTAAVWVCLWVSTPMTSSAESASMCIALAPCPETTWSVPVRDEARQDCDGTRPLASGGQAPPSGQQLRLGRRRQPRVDKSSAGHPTGSVILRVTPAATSSSPGSSPNRWAVSQSFSPSFHQTLLNPTRPHWPESPPNPGPRRSLDSSLFVRFHPRGGVAVNIASAPVKGPQGGQQRSGHMYRNERTPGP